MKNLLYMPAVAVTLLVSGWLTQAQARGEGQGEGTLQVFTVTRTRPDGDSAYAYPHSGYTIYDTIGHSVRYVANHVGRSDPVPTAVSLRAGSYFIEAEIDSGATFSEADIKDADSLAGKLRKQEDKVSAFLWGKLQPGTRQMVESSAKGDAEPVKELRRALAHDLNGVLMRERVYEQERFANVSLSKGTESLLHRELQGARLARLNRMLLEDAYPGELAKGKEVFGRQRIPVEVQAGGLTVLHLENDWEVFGTHPESHLVRLTDGHVVGWREGK
jgi:hypothetical protein